MATATTTRFALLIGLGPLVRAVAAPAATAASVECDKPLARGRLPRDPACGRGPLVERASTLPEEREMLLPTNMRSNLSRGVLRDTHRRLEQKDPREDAVHQHEK